MLAALIMSTGGAAIKACSSCTSWQIACLRAGVAAAVLLLAVPDLRRNCNLRTIAVGSAYAGASVLFVMANKLTTSANAIFLQNTSPITIALLSAWLLKENLKLRDALFMLALGGGLSLFFLGGHHPLTSAPDPARGDALALLSGVFWAVTVVGLRWLANADRERGGSAPAAVTFGCLIAFCATLPLALPAAPPPVPQWFIVAALGVFQVALVFLMIGRAIRRVTALEAGLLLLLEPALNPLWAWLLHGENPGAAAVAGGAIIIAATALHSCRPAPLPAPSL